MDGKMPYCEQMRISMRLRTQQPLDLAENEFMIDRIKLHAAVEVPDKDRLSEVLLMTATSMDMDRYFCGDIDAWIESVTDRLRTYASQYVAQANCIGGFKGDEPLPPDVIFRDIKEF